jgi:hypothetical protein
MANQKISNPPDVDITLALLKKEFDNTDIDSVVRDVDLHELTESDESSNSDIDSTPKTKRERSRK